MININNSMVNKLLYKLTLQIFKIIPMIYALLSLLNTILSYFNINVDILSYIGSVSLVTLVLLYTTSYVFNFCEYHRMFIHYIIIIYIINCIDYYIGIPISDYNLFILYSIITIISLFLILYFKIKNI